MHLIRRVLRREPAVDAYPGESFVALRRLSGRMILVLMFKQP